MTLEQYGQLAKQASYILAQAAPSQKNQALIHAAALLQSETEAILAANAQDLARAKEKGMTEAMQDRLRLTASRIEGIAEGVRQVTELADPIGEIVEGTKRPNGLEIIKKRVPLGVLGIIYEARPNVTADAAALSIKSGNVCILRGGSEAICSNIAISKVFRRALAEAGFPEDCVQLIEDTSHETAQALMRMNQYVDVLIPRGGARLIQTVVQQATVPVIQTGTGNCHVYVDSYAQLPMALDIVDNAKTQRPSVCNAAETLLVHKDVAAEFLPQVARLLRSKNVELRVCAQTAEILRGAGISDFVPATPEDWATEYNNLILTIGVVDSLWAAIDHIQKYSTHHSEAIVTENYGHARAFQERIDAACVYVNASTRFTDGFEFGFGAEIGISNQKLHARGPMGLKELTTYKYLINGNGQVR
ncbi:MAG: glutamate-5-semialdehyde dehydrogenase [Clostridia bacterium]|nr:glutamate-5-semialdehyde dehydrogenase [Clostridia bacterium]